MKAHARPGDILAGVILWAMAAVIVQQSTTWPVAGDVAGNPVVFPRILAAIMALAGLALVVLRRPEPEGETDGTILLPGRTVQAIIATVVLALALDWLGLIAAGIAYVLVLQRIAGAPWRAAVPFAVATPVVIWLVFVAMLRVPLPVGQLWKTLIP